MPFQHISLVYLEAALKSAETKTGESFTTFPATKGCGMSWRLTANRWKKCFRTPISSTSAKVDKSSTQTILRNPDLSHGRRIFRRMVLRAVIWTNKFSQTDCAGRTLSSGFSSCPWLKTKIDGWTMDKQISMSCGAKSNIKINGQTNSVLFVYWFIEFYLLCDCSIFVFVEERDSTWNSVYYFTQAGIWQRKYRYLTAWNRMWPRNQGLLNAVFVDVYHNWISGFIPHLIHWTRSLRTNPNSINCTI